ncbi:GTP-binding protein [Flavobacteriaceae bacterium M23B6Z8]
MRTHEKKSTLINHFSIPASKPFHIKQSGDHIFIKFDQDHTTFWSPQLHLEVVQESDNESFIYGLFGPSPSLWTFFMFLHFGIATVFIIFGIWGYSNWSLQEPYALQMAVCIFMIILWFALYAFGRMGKSQGKEQMHELYKFMQNALKDTNMETV